MLVVLVCLHVHVWYYARPSLQDNPYVVAIKSVASVLASYGSDQKFPVFGFGAKVPHIGGVSHCFPLNGNPDRPEVEGIEVCSYYIRLVNICT